MKPFKDNFSLGCFHCNKNLNTIFSHPEILITALLKLKGDVQLEECKKHSKQAEEHTAQRIAQHTAHDSP